MLLDHPSYPWALLWILKCYDSGDKSDLDSKVRILSNLLILRGSWKLFVELLKLLNKWTFHRVSEGPLTAFMRQHGSLASGYLLLIRPLFSGGLYERAWQASK